MKCFSSINNDSDLMPNHAQWLRRDLWRIDHAVCLLRNVEPEEAANLFSLMDGFEALYTGDIQTVLSAENISLDIEGTESHGAGLSIQYSKVRPKVFIQWANSKDYEIPQPFEHLLEAAEEQHSKDLDIREKKTLLRIVHALAIDCGYSLAEPHKDSEEVVKNADLKGLKIPAAKTIAEKLKEAKKLIEEEP